MVEPRAALPVTGPAPSGDAMRWRTGVCLLVLALAVFAALFPALAGDFLRWDDDALVLKNGALLKGRWAELFGMRMLGNWHPLTLFSLALDYQLYGLEPFGFHLTSVLLHVANTLLVALLMLRLFSGRPVNPLGYCLICAALFGLHPLHVESAAWIGERKDVLFSLFYLLAMLVHLRHCDREIGEIGESRGVQALARLALVWLLGCAALASKPMAVSLPIVLLLLGWVRGRRLDGRACLEQLPLFAAAVAIGVVTLNAQAPPDPENFAVYEMGVLERSWHGIEGLVFYASKTLFPESLSVYYDAEFVSVEPHQYVIAFAAFAALALFAIFRRESRRDILFGLGFWLVSLAPVLKLLSFGFDSAFNDRYMYLPSVGFFLAFGRPLLDLPSWPRAAQAAVAIGIACLLATLGVQSFTRSGVFTTEERLWRDVLLHYPDTPVALDHLGLFFEQDAGDLEAAIDQYRLAIAARPRYGNAHFHLGRAMEELGRFDEAVLSYEEALRWRPTDLALHVNAAAFFRRRDDDVRAQELLEAAIRVAPNFLPAHHNLGNLFTQLGQFGRAKVAYEHAIEAAPDQPSSYWALARIYEEEGNLPRALEYEEAAAARGQSDPESLRRLRRASRRRGRAKASRQ